jgi:hypothetical protein
MLSFDSSFFTVYVQKFFQIYRAPSFEFKTTVSVLPVHNKLALMSKLVPAAKICSGALIFRILLSGYMRYNTYHRNWHHAATTYHISAPLQVDSIQQIFWATDAGTLRTSVNL